MASVVGRGYNGGVSYSGAANPMGTDQVHVTPPDQNGVQHTIVPNGVSSNDLTPAIASGLAGLAGSSDTVFGDILRYGDTFRSLNSAETQARAERQMEYQTESDRYAMNWSAEEAAKNREWQERLSSTAHQREVQDLLKAGLNPILSAGGNGASTPSGSVGQSHSSSGASGQVDMSNPLDVLSTYFLPILNSAVTMSSLDVQRQMQSERLIGDLAVAQEYAGATAYAADMGYNSAVISAEAGERNNKRSNESTVLAHKLDNATKEHITQMQHNQEKDMWRLNHTVAGNVEQGKEAVKAGVELANMAYANDPGAQDPKIAMLRHEASGGTTKDKFTRNGGHSF